MRRIAIVASRREIDTPEAFAGAHRLGLLLGENRLTVIVQTPLVGPLGTVVDAALSTGGRVMVLATADLDPPSPDAEVRRVATDGDARSETGNHADAFLVLPGGVESLESAFELWTWATDREPDQPLGVWDDREFFSELLRAAGDDAVDRFARESQRGQLVVSRDPTDVLRRLADYRPPETRRFTAFDDD
ncbi:MAG: LOG family protein [Gemmatimonadales bacterium]